MAEDIRDDDGGGETACQAEIDARNHPGFPDFEEWAMSEDSAISMVNDPSTEPWEDWCHHWYTWLAAYDKYNCVADDDDAAMQELGATVNRQSKIIDSARAKLQEIVCTEEVDAGVVLLSNDGPTHKEKLGDREFEVYDHQYFSPLGDALIELHKILGGEVWAKADGFTKVSGVLCKLNGMPPDHSIYVMDMPDKGDMQYRIQDIQEWDGCITIVFDSEKANEPEEPPEDDRSDSGDVSLMDGEPPEANDSDDEDTAINRNYDP